MTLSLSRSIRGKVAVITGAASGMGLATARLFAQQGACVAALDINQDKLDLVCSEEPIGNPAAKTEEGSGEIVGWCVDLTSPEAIQQCTDEIATRFGGIEILVNNAGISIPVKIDDENYDAHWCSSLEVLLSAHQRMIRAALPWLRRAESPRIVNIASTEGLGATRYQSPYTAAKHGVIGLTRALAVELGAEGITVNCICPGPVRTAMTAAIPEAKKQVFASRRVALQRYAEPEEVAHATLSLVLPAASFITGVALPVDGGLTIRNA